MPISSRVLHTGAVPISALLGAIRSAAPNATALRDGCRSIGYGTLAGLLEDEIDWLGQDGGERHAVLADNGVGWAIADLALHVGGFLSVPVPEAFTPAQVSHALDDAGIDSVLTDDLARARHWLPGWHDAGIAPASRLHRLRRRLDPSNRLPVPLGTAKVTYTSGSTAAPRGVCLAAAGLEATAAALAHATDDLRIERHLCLLPLATLLENVAGLYAPLLRGAACIVPSCRTTGMSYAGLDSTRLLQAITGHAPNSLILVPALLQALVAAAEAGWPVPPSLRFVAVGGAKVSTDVLARAEQVGLPVFEGYGLSECASVVCLNTSTARRPGTVGRPLPHLGVRIDASGEVCITGTSTLLGYLGDVPRTPGTQVATGDLGELDADGYLHLQGRAGNRFITSYGRNVSPEWIEAELSQRLDGRPVLAYGEAQPHVVVLVDARPTDVDDAAIERAVDTTNAVLPDYARVRRWARVPRPFSYADGTMTANGRLRRAVLHERHSSLLASLYEQALAS